jgi:DNA-binding transcriptional LysR family regulator
VVRLGCSVAFGRLQVVPRLGPLLHRHPGLSVDLVMTDSVSDLVLENLDVALRIGVVTDPDLVVRRIGLTRRSVFGAPAYLDRAGTPQHPRDLERHACVRFTASASGDEWPFEGPDGAFRVQVRGQLSASSSEAVRSAVLSGLGLGLLPVWMLCPESRRGEVVPVLQDWTPTPLPIQAVFPTRRQMPARVRAVVEYLAGEFRLDPLLTDYAAAA